VVTDLLKHLNAGRRVGVKALPVSYTFYIVAKEFIFVFRFAQLVSPLFLPHRYNSKPRLERIVVAGQLG